jgi:coenzyme F420-reducing hydrogenase beta subunit
MEKEKFESMVLEGIYDMLSFSADYSIEEIEYVEYNCGTMWLEMKDGSSFSMSLMECEE